MFERFTEKAIKVIMLAQEEARRLGHNFVGTEQILLGLIGEGAGIAAKTLKTQGVTLKRSREEVEKIIGRGNGFVAVEIPFTPRAKRVLELSWDEARKLEHTFIGTEHLLLGLLREGDGVGPRVLEILGIDPIETANMVLESLPGVPAEKFWTDVPSKFYKSGTVPIAEDALLNRNWDIEGVTHVLELAHRVARETDSSCIEVEHVLIGLSEGDDCVSSRVLESAGLDKEQFKNHIKEKRGNGSGSPAGEMPYSDEVILLINDAWLHVKKSKAARKRVLSSGHILLALLEPGRRRALEILSAQNVDLDILRGAVLEQLGSEDDYEEKIDWTDQKTKRLFQNYDELPKLSSEIREILGSAFEESKAISRTLISTRELLLAILKQHEGLGSKILREFNVTLSVVHTILEESTIQKLPQLKPTEIMLRSDGAEAMRLAHLAASLFGSQDVNSGHLLLALMSINDASLNRVLTYEKIDPAKLRTALLLRLAAPSETS